EGPATIYANVDADGLGAGGFGARITVSSTNVGGFDFIPAQSGRSIDAEAGLVWDATGGPFNNRIYLVYTDETVNENNDTDIMMRTSTDDGATWSAPVRVNDDATTNSQFLPYVALDPTTGTVAVGFHDARNDNGVPGPGGTNNIPNDDAEYYGSFSTDGGVTWAPNQRLSGGFSNATASGNGIDFGDYVGLSALTGKLYTAWGDNANCDGTNPNGTLHQFDLYGNPLVLTGGTPTPTPTASPTPSPTPTPTLTPTPTPTPCESGVIQNGGFETGDFTGWIIDGHINDPVVTNTQAHSGTFSAFSGGNPQQNTFCEENNNEPLGDSSFYQQFTVPAGASTLSFWHKDCTNDSITFDWQDAYITDSNGNILQTIFHVCDTADWTNQTVDMSPYAGQTVRIKFLVHQDGFNPPGDTTGMWVDDVILYAP